MVLFDDGTTQTEIRRCDLPPGGILKCCKNGLDVFTTIHQDIGSKHFPERRGDKQYGELLQTVIALKVQNRNMNKKLRVLYQTKDDFFNLLDRYQALKLAHKKEKEQHQKSLETANEYITHLQKKLKQTELDEELADEQRHRYRTKYLEKFDEVIALEEELKKAKEE